MEAESTTAELAVMIHASLVGSGAGARDPPHAVDSSVGIATRKRLRTYPVTAYRIVAQNIRPGGAP